MGFLTKEFTVDRGGGPEALIAVYVPTNHLYLGDIVICERERATLSRHHGRRRDPDFSDRRHVAAARCGSSERRPKDSGYNPSFCAAADDPEWLPVRCV